MLLFYMKIVLSLTAHESIECLYDLIENIKHCFVHYDILILLSMTDSLYKSYQDKYDFVKVVTRRNSYNIWGTIHLFHQHILNLQYLVNNQISYDHFWFVASNEMFIKVIPPTFLQEHGLKINGLNAHPTDYDLYYDQFMTTKSDWHWFDLCKKDSHFMNYVYTHKYTLYKCNHEGLVLPYDISKEILDEYTKHQFYEKSTFPNYVMEEIFISTYIFNKYNVDKFPFFCYRYIYDLGKIHPMSK